MKLIKKFESYTSNESNLLKEHGETSNYMFFGNLKTIKRLVDEMLEMDEAKVDAMLLNGHNWAVDHIATSKDDVEEVFNFLAGHNLPKHEHEMEMTQECPSCNCQPCECETEEGGIKSFHDFK